MDGKVVESAAAMPVTPASQLADAPVTFRALGVIRSEHRLPEKTPVQPVFAQACLGTVEIFPEYAEGLKDLEGFSHLYLIYHLHRAPQPQLVVKPFLQDCEHGIFATRFPARPNAIGLSVVELLGREQNVLHIRGVDILDGTPLLDIKPYSARFDHIEAKRSGWMEQVNDAAAVRRGKRGYTAPN